MGQLKLTIATTDYDHFRDFRLGLVKAEGIDHTWLTLGHHEVFARFTFNREWDVSELSFAKFMAQVTRKDSDIVGLPVVCSRLFRFSSFYVNKKSKIKTAKDLKGKTIGSPEWAHTAAVYMRGWLNDEHGVALKDVHWYQAGANEAGRIEKVELSLPEGMKLTRVSDKSLSELLAAGEIDCALIARPPNCFLQGHPDVERLFPDYLGDGGGVLQAHQGVADHAHHLRAETDPRRTPVGGPQSSQRLRGVEAAQYRAAARSGRVALSGRLAADIYAQDARYVWRRHFPLWHRGEPPDAGAILPLYLRARHRPPACYAGGALPEGHHDIGSRLRPIGEVIE